MYHALEYKGKEITRAALRAHILSAGVSRASRRRLFCMSLRTPFTGPSSVSAFGAMDKGFERSAARVLI